jgi:GAF domain-containing protein
MPRRPTRKAEGRRKPPTERLTAVEARSDAAKLLEAIEEKTEQLGLINGVLRTIVSGAPLPEILRVFAINLKTLVPYDRCSIAIYDEKEGVFHVRWKVTGGRVQATNEPPRPYSSTPLSEVVETRRPVLRSNIRRSERGYEADDEFAKKGFGCELLMPLQVGDRVLGTFNLGTYEPERIQARHAEVVAEILPAIAVAIWKLS